MAKRAAGGIAGIFTEEHEGVNFSCRGRWETDPDNERNKQGGQRACATISFHLFAPPVLPRPRRNPLNSAKPMAPISASHPAPNRTSLSCGTTKCIYPPWCGPSLDGNVARGAPLKPAPRGALYHDGWPAAGAGASVPALVHLAMHCSRGAAVGMV